MLNEGDQLTLGSSFTENMMIIMMDMINAEAEGQKKHQKQTSDIRSKIQKKKNISYQ